MKSDSNRGSKRNRASADFKRQADQRQRGLAAELIDFILHNKKWWLTPILVVLLLLGILVFLSGTGAAPFLYTIF
jgi:hypothetical protein